MTQDTHTGVSQIEGPEAGDDMLKAKSAAHVETTLGNLEYHNDDEEPEMHSSTWIAISAMCMLAFATLFALQGPNAVLSQIGQDLHVGNSASVTWVATSMVTPQAVLAPVISSAADTFQVRKWLLVVLALIGVVGAAIAPGSGSISRLIGAQVLIGFALISTPLCNLIPSEILPRKWRPMAQAMFNFSAMAGAIVGPLLMGALVRANPHSGWRTYYWIEMGVWALAAACVVLGYRPPQRHTKYDHLSWFQKLAQLDIIGSVLFTIGLTLFLVGIGLGGGLYPWKSAPVLSTLIIGICVLIVFAGYEWKGTKTGIFHHDLFRAEMSQGRNFAILLCLMLVEGILMYAFVVFFPILTTELYASDVVVIVAHLVPFYATALVSTVVWGYISTKLRSIRETMFAGFVIFTAGIAALATLQLDSSTNSVIFGGLAGIGFGAPIVLINAGVQLIAPHHLIATATAVTLATRAVGATIFTTFFSLAFSNGLTRKMPEYIARAATGLGLPVSSLPAFIAALLTSDQAALAKVPGATGPIVTAAITASKQAFLDSIRVVYIMAAPFGVVACIGSLFLGNVGKTMNYHVEAPVEELHAKHRAPEYEHELGNAA